VRLSQEEVDLEGRTRDLSSAGAYFVVTGPVEPGSPIEFFVTLQDNGTEIPQDAKVRLHCRGHVMRLDKLEGSERLGVAATIDRYQFVRDSLN
jgi:hypothetical protein